MADNYFLWIKGAMDRLWFHQIILFSEPTTSIAPKPPLIISESLSCQSSLLSVPPPLDEENSTDESPSPEKQALSDSISDDSTHEEEMEERPTRMDLLGNKARSHSSSPSTQSRHRKFRKPAATRRLQKCMSCRTLGELELEEVQGFMDLGFIFKKECISQQMMSVIPGLQRLGMHQIKQNTELNDARVTVGYNDAEEERNEKRDIMRPYLYEAWLIMRPNSPLLNLKVPKLRSTADMKKHLRFWAKTVATEILQQ